MLSGGSSTPSLAQRSGQGGLHQAARKGVIQLNDNHPALALPELICILEEEEGLAFNEAFKIGKKT